MFSLFVKEINSFFSSIVGYLVIIVFLTIIGLVMWVFPSVEFNVLDSGYASIDTLFVIAPWVFMFLIPAITMRTFSEENRTGTIELLLTKPLTDFEIINAKYFSSLILLIISILPTLIYFYSVSELGNPKGNVDTGGMWGSYIGLLFLGGAFVSIGLFASSLSDNQIVAFIVAVFLCFFSYIGFDSVSSLALFGKIDSFILKLGINEHYVSMSRGVIDSRDLVYFFSVILFFQLLTKTKLESRKW